MSTMTYEKANDYIDEFLFEKSKRTKSEENKFIQCLQYLIDEHDEDWCYMELGAFYRGHGNMTLAKKYIKKAAEKRVIQANTCLGQLYLNENKLKEAYKCFLIDEELGDHWASYYIGLMYRDGDYLKKDRKKYKEIMEKLYSEADPDDDNPYQNIIGDVSWELAAIYYEDMHDNKKSEEYFKIAIKRLKYTASLNDIHDSLSPLKSLMKDYRDIFKTDYNNMDIADVLLLAGKKGTVKFKYRNKLYKIEIDNILNEPCYKIGNQYFNDIVKLFNEAKLSDGVLREKIELIKDVKFIEQKEEQ